MIKFFSKFKIIFYSINFFLILLYLFPGSLLGLIIYEDKNYIVINKDAGIAVHGGSKNYIGIIDIARKIYGRNIDLCHRLDKNTSGCLVLAKNKQSAKHFNNLIFSSDVKK